MKAESAEEPVETATEKETVAEKETATEKETKPADAPKAAEEPKTAAEETVRVQIVSSLEGVSYVTVGTEMVLTAKVDDPLNRPCTYQWEVSTDGGKTFTPMAGETQESLSVILTPDNAASLWRVTVHTLDV